MNLPPEITSHASEISIAGLGVIFGWFIARLSAAGKITALRESERAGERRATELEARLAHAIAEARQSAQQAQTSATQLAELRSKQAAAPPAANPEAGLVAILRRVESRLAALEVESREQRAEMDGKLRALEESLAGMKKPAGSATAFPSSGFLEPAMKEAFNTAGMSEDFAFVPEERAAAAAGNLRSARL